MRSTERRARVRLKCSGGPRNICYRWLEERGRELFNAVCRLDLEGIMAKRKVDPYAERATWYKVKNPTYTQAEGRRDLFERR